MPSPRRSTRSALPPPKPEHRNSSSSSLSSARPERSTRSHHKSSPNQQSVSPLSSADGDVPAQHAVGDHEQEDDGPVEGAAEGADITRCICGHQEYPGPPLTDDTKSRSDVSDDAGGLFIQCDKCSVWQHGGCVGIMDEDKTPEDYFCEQCDKRLHQVHTDPRG